jgi:hypothetical protein
MVAVVADLRAQGKGSSLEAAHGMHALGAALAAQGRGGSATARAEAVAKYLAKLGVRQWIRFQGAGAMKSDWGDWRDRRVVVHAGGNFGSV